MLRNYFKTAWRSIIKNRGTSLINITGLSVGLTAAVLIMLWVLNEMNFDNNHQNQDRIYRLKTSLKENNWVWETTPLLLADAVKKQIPEIEKVSRLYTSNWPVFKVAGNFTYEKKAAYVDDDWFNIFHYDVVAGNLESFAQNPNSIILTVSAAEKYFGKRRAVGEEIRIDSINYQVKAIVKNPVVNSSFQYNVFLPLVALLTDKQRRENDENWSNFNYLTFVKLKQGSDPAVTAKKVTAILPDNQGTTISLISLKDMHFENDLQSSSFVHGNRNTVYIFSLLAFLLLLVACINYVNLTTAKASLRSKEVSVRKMVGAKRIHLFYQFISESLFISIIALITTLVLIKVCLPWFNIITGKSFVVTLTSINMWQVIGITLFTALLLCSIYPALLLSSFKPLNVFRGTTILKVKDSAFRKGLTIVQFTISVALIACTIVIYCQMKFIQQTNPGYNRSQVLSFPLPLNIGNDKKESLIQSIKQQLLSHSSIKSVSTTNQPIVNIGSISTGSADWNGHDTTFNPKITQLSADADFQKIMQLQMKEGRWFEQGNQADGNNVVLNESAVAQLNIPKPVIGQRFTFKGRTGQIIGVVKDFTYQSLHNKTGPLVAFNDPQWFRFFMVRTVPGKSKRAIDFIQSIWKKQLPGHPVEYNFLDDNFNELYKEDQRTSFLIFVFAIIAVLISSLGLFGLAAFTTEQRAKEIGIRKVLGATVENITTMLSRDFVKLISIAIIIAVPVAFFAMNKWMQNFAYRTDITWWMFALAGLLALLIALVTISFQAIKAAIANPIKSLRTE
ncbi:ABC transporter permease [Rubrolithibacter danxiaensis]|uniref:ABC transporter permease n=1 Tax=Rubrolithibacter danxiaensis TaxID=3390805 RepID=UPI003BF85E05